MPELPEMNVQAPLQNTKPATATASQLKQPSAPLALVAIFFDISWSGVKSSAEALWQVVWSIWMPAALTVCPTKPSNS